MNSSDIFFSVIIPLFNKEKYIARAVESVLNQSVNDYEVIVVDDGSTDRSFSELQRFSSKVRLIRQANQGVSAARNEGIKAAKYDYLAFLDADDEWKPDFLKEMKRLIQKYPSAGAYCCKREHIDAATGDKVLFPKIEIIGNEVVVDQFFQFVIDHNDYPESSSSTVVPRNVLEKVGVFPIGEPIREDIDLWTRISLEYDVVLSDQVCSIIHTHTENNSRNNSQKNVYKGGLQVVQTIKQAIKSGKISEDEREHAEKFLELCQVGHAVINIRGGNPREGRRYLKGIKSRFYRKKKWLWYMLSYLPSGILEKLIKLSHS